MHPIRGIYALCDTSLSPAKSHVELAKELLLGGVDIIQLRMKGETNTAKVRDTAHSIRSLKRERPFTFIVNDFIDVALEIGADGVHLGRDDLDLIEARKLTGPDLLIGYSSHSLEEAMEAERLGADYVALGAIFPTATKGPGHPVVGLDTLRRVVQKLTVPVVAIGGINEKNFSEVLATGVHAVAMIGALTLAPDIPVQARWFVERFK
jgi:thiamine-phosphate pyrophosphorylase